MAVATKAIDFYKQFGEALNELVNMKGFKVEDKKPAGRPSRYLPNQREYRLQLVNPERDTKDELIAFLETELRNTNGISNVVFNDISPNSSKFSSYSFIRKDDNIEYSIDAVIARGANRGEKFEIRTVRNLKEYFKTRQDAEFAKLVDQMNKSYPAFADVEIENVTQRTGSTLKEGVPIEKLGEIIGDIILEDTTRHKWFVSLKDINGITFSAYSGAASIFNAQGVLQPESKGADFLKAFGVDLNLVQRGFDVRKSGADGDVPKKGLPLGTFNSRNLVPIFERAWGMNYFYVKRERQGFTVFWLDRPKLNKLTGNINVTEIRYPGKSSKQITIKCNNKYMDYTIEIRNSKGGEYPNDIKFKNVKKELP